VAGVKRARANASSPSDREAERCRIPIPFADTPSSRNRQIATRYALDLDHIGALHEHGTAFELVAKGRAAAVLIDARGKEVLGLSRAESNQNTESCVRTPPCRNAGRQDVVERGDAIGRNDEQPVLDLVHVADLTFGVIPGRELCFQDDVTFRLRSVRGTFTS